MDYELSFCALDDKCWLFNNIRIVGVIMGQRPPVSPPAPTHPPSLSPPPAPPPSPPSHPPPPPPPLGISLQVTVVN